ncbi:MAG: hypothetical protein E7221_05580 [Clostridiales bacterium]|nr:hypothetical protein [Clostridiales bacterium]
MKINRKTITDYILDVEILVDKEEFDRARYAAYMENTDRYPVMGKAPGLAGLPDLEMTYGPAVLFDEALNHVIPDTFNQFLGDEGIRIMGRPQVSDMQFMPDGGVQFTVKADMYPDVQLGQYEGIAVPFRRSEQQLEFEQAVVQKACENMKGEIPPHMVEQKLDAITAQEKINVNNDAVYHLLADMLVVVDEAYKAADVVRPKVQVRREAMDLMLQTASAEHEMDWKEYFRSQIKDMAERYHDLPADYDAKLDKIFAARDKAKASQTPEERTEELFKAYLGSLELTEEQWRNQRQLQAARDVCLDLLLDAVAAEKKIEITPAEVRQFIEEIAAQAGMEPEEAEANINKDPLIWKLKRDKALVLILNSAVTDEEGKKKLDEARAKAREKAAKAAVVKEQ